jgi:hypothetical protein
MFQYDPIVTPFDNDFKPNQPFVPIRTYSGSELKNKGETGFKSDETAEYNSGVES